LHVQPSDTTEQIAEPLYRVGATWPNRQIPVCWAPSSTLRGDYVKEAVMHESNGTSFSVDAKANWTGGSHYGGR